MAILTSPSGYLRASCFVALGGFLNGYDTGAIGGVTEMDAFLKQMGHLSPFMRGFVVSVIMLAGAVPGIFAGYFADRFGRLRVVTVGAIIFAIGAVLQASAFDIKTFTVGRALAGLGQGLWLSNISIYICEVSPSARRGMLVSIPQFLCVSGICAGYFTVYGSGRLSMPFAWRIPFVVMAVVAGMLAFSSFFLPESPRWLLLQGRRDDAMKAIQRLDFVQAEAEKDILQPVEQDSKQPGMLEGLRLLFAQPYRLPAIVGLLILGGIQLSGIDAVLYYAPTLFANAGMPGQQASFLASGVSAILMLAISVPAVFLADRWGRRTSIISGGLILGSAMAIIGALYASNSVHPSGAARWVVVVLIFVFALTYCATWAVVGKLYAAEIQPTRTRATASAIAQGLNFFMNWVVAITAPVFLAESSFGIYFLYGVLSLVLVVILAAMAPETRNVPLEEIQENFHMPIYKWLQSATGRFMRKQRASQPQEGIELSGVGHRSSASTPQPVPIVKSAL